MPSNNRQKRLNVQGLARRDRRLMECLVPDDGYITVSMDLAAGEPTVTSHFSQDKNYRYACFDGVGKAPFYKDGVLMLSDIYLMTMSVSPLGREKMADAFKNARFDGRTFSEQWLIDDESIKRYFKKDRQLHKMLCIAEGTLVRVRGEGWQAIEKIKKGAEIWDGVEWVQTSGPVCNGTKEVITRFGVSATADHLIMTDAGWAPIGDATHASTTGSPDSDWSEVWKMVRRFFGSRETWAAPLYLGRLWMRRSMEALRQSSFR